MKILITGSSGLIGGEAVEYFDKQGHTVVGLDNNMRMEFFGDAGDTRPNLARISRKTKNFIHCHSDIRDYHAVYHAFYEHGPFDVVIHCAAQPSHDKAKDIPLIDFAVNATGTLNLLEACRQKSPNAVFIFMSTNKVYGDTPNWTPIIEHEMRYDYMDECDFNGVSENMSIDQSTHSVFGASKSSADLMVQEYGRYFGMKTTVFRGGCLTGPGHSSVELHGFLSYLVKCVVTGKHYTVFGYKGKQVRDNIHSYDVIRAMEEVIKAPRCREVYNIGGGRENSTSVLEAISTIEGKLGKKLDWDYKEANRIGDHICYISDLSKFKSHYPNWSITKSLDTTIDEMIQKELWTHYCDCEESKVHSLNENSIVFDVGGYKGDWSAEIIRRYNPHVYIFEPITEFGGILTKRFASNPKVKVFYHGLSDQYETEVVCKFGASTSRFLDAEAEWSTTDGNGKWEHAVFCDVYEEHAETNGLQLVDLISLNCEGGEFAIIQRLLDTGDIVKFRNIQIQFHDVVTNAKELRNALRERLRATHEETYCYPWVWESWKLK